MAYFKINNIDFSDIVSELRINKKNIYNSQTNANGDTVVDLINSKRVIEVGIIPIKQDRMNTLLNVLNDFSVSITFRNPKSGALETDVLCIVPDLAIDYYTIQSNKVLFNAFNIKFTEL